MRGFVVCRPTDFLTGARIRSQKMWENSWTQKNQKSIRQYFKISAKKTILDPATVEYQLNDSFFSPVSIKLRYWDDEYMNQSHIKIAGWRNKSTEDHDSYKYAIYAVGKRKPGALLLLRYTDLFLPSYLRLFCCNLTLLSSKQEGFEYISSQLKFQWLYIIAISKL